MKTDHLLPWEQEEYVMRERTPQMVAHVGQCTDCRAAVEQMERAVSVFRNAAVAWSSESLARRTAVIRPAPALVGRWALAALIPVALLVLLFFTFPRSSPTVARPAAALSDDALLEQVDEQLSVAVPSSMQSLTYLVSTEKTVSGGGNASVPNN